MSPITVNAVRYGIPAVLFIAGMVVWATGGSRRRAARCSSARPRRCCSLNVLFRIGVEGDKERDREDEARRFFDEHGRWPDEPEGAEPYRPSCLPRISFITSSVPPPIGPRRVSRTARSISYSFM